MVLIKMQLYRKISHKMNINFKKTLKLSFQEFFTLVTLKLELLLIMIFLSDTLNFSLIHLNFGKFFFQNYFCTFLCSLLIRLSNFF